MNARESPSGILTAGDVATLVGGRLEGEADRPVRGIAPIDEAGPEEIGFLAVRGYLPFLSTTRAGALLVASDLADDLERADAEGTSTRIFVDDPHGSLPALLEVLHPPQPPPPDIHPTAVLGRGVRLGEGVAIGPYAVLEDEVEIGDRTRIGAHVVIGKGSRVGADSHLHPHVVLYAGTVLGTRVVVHAGTRIGVDGFGYATESGRHRKIPQVGRCVIEDDVEIGANATVDRGSIGSTRIGAGTKLDNLVHVGHHVRIGEGSILVAQVGIAGSTRIGTGVMLGGQAGVGGHLEIGDGVRVTGRGGVIGDVEAGATVSGFPARDHRTFFRGMAAVMKLPELVKRVRSLEARLDPPSAGS